MAHTLAMAAQKLNGMLGADMTAIISVKGDRGVAFMGGDCDKGEIADKMRIMKERLDYLERKFREGKIDLSNVYGCSDSDEDPTIIHGNDEPDDTDETCFPV